MSGRALQAVPDAGTRGGRHGDQGWAGWLRARLDPAWRAGEWDGQTLLFTGDLDSAPRRGRAAPPDARQRHAAHRGAVMAAAAPG